MIKDHLKPYMDVEHMLNMNINILEFPTSEQMSQKFFKYLATFRQMTFVAGFNSSLSCCYHQSRVEIDGKTYYKPVGYDLPLIM